MIKASWGKTDLATEPQKALRCLFHYKYSIMFLPIQYKPDTSKPIPEKFVFVSEGYVSPEMCKDVREYLDSNPSTHRRGSKTPEICNASFSTCLMPEPTKTVYAVLDLLLIDYNARHNFDLTYMEPFELKRYDIGDEFTPHTDNYKGTDYGLDRKLNLIVQLSEPDSYDGGTLTVGEPPFTEIPRTLGTVTIFPANYVHAVTKVTRGARYSLIGHVWGPEFK